MRKKVARNAPTPFAEYPFQSANYSYDHSFGRLSNIQTGSDVFTYDYRADLGQPTSLTAERGDTDLVFRQEWARDNLGRETKLRFTYGPAAAPKVGYQVERRYNARGQARWDVLGGDRKWEYEYDDLGQVQSAQKQLTAGGVLPGYDFGFTYDSIGNRIRATINGREEDYTSNLLNQYEEREVSGAVDVRGSAATTAHVLVNDALANPGTPPRSTPEFFKAVEVNNSFAPVLAEIKILAVDSAFSPAKVATQTRQAYVASTPEQFLYDLNGNLTEDGRWHYSWDAENRLKSIEATQTAVMAGMPRERYSYVYDSEGRRVSKTQEIWDDGGEEYAGVTTTFFVWDGWLLVSELSVGSGDALTPSVGYTWGPDISGSLTATGGVGGLVQVRKFDTGKTYAPAYGANGNIVAYVDLGDHRVSASYEYGSFGEVVQKTGPTENLSFGFSTKYLDRESGFNYYGYRYYAPINGRWISRDPIEEADSLNIYSFVYNDPLGSLDALGLSGASSRAWSPSTAIGYLTKVAREWRGEGWSFAANLLEAFYTKRGGYSSSSTDANKIKVSSVYRDAAKSALWKLAKEKSDNGEKGAGLAVSEGSSSGSDWAFEARYGFFSDDELKRALGGAHFYFKGTMDICGTGRILKWKAKLDMTQQDFYTFEPEGALSARLLIPSYNESRKLQMNYGFAPFTHSETWKDEFTSDDD